MAVYRYKTPADQKKLAAYSAGSNRNGGTSRASARPYYGGGRTRMGAEQQARIARDVRRAGKAGTGAHNKKRIMKVYMVRKAARKLREKKGQARQQERDAQRADAAAVNEAVDKLQDGAEQAAVIAAHGVKKYGGRAARAVYSAAKERVGNHSIKRSVRRVARRYRGADGKLHISFRYEARSRRTLRSVQLKKGQRYRVVRGQQKLLLRGPVTRRQIPSKTAYGASRSARSMNAVYGASRSARSANTVYGARRSAAAAARTQAQLAAGQMRYAANAAAQNRRGARSLTYRLRARVAGIRRLKQKQIQTLVAGAGHTAKSGLFRSVGAVFSKIAGAAKGKVVLIGAVAAIIIVSMFAAPVSIFSSAVGILFADDNAASMEGSDVQSVRQAYLASQMAWQEQALRGESYDRVSYEGAYADDAEVLAVFSVKLTEKDGLDAMTMGPEQREILAEVYKVMNPYRKWTTKTKDGDRILHIGISALTADQAADKYHFNKGQKNMLHELLDDYRPDLLALIAGIGGAGGYPGEPIVGDAYKALMEEAQKYIGWPYVYGGSSPATSFDCSGYICWVYTQSGVYNLPRTTAQGIYGYCTPVSPSEAQPGDLVFFQGTYDFYETITHIGIYVGNNKMLHCGNPIGYADITSSYWQSHFYGFGRLGK